MTKFDIHAEITNKIIESINAGTPPWRKPWTGSKSGAAFPLRSTGEGYRGINILMLWLAAEERGYSSAHWFTFKQAKDLGANVRKGEKSNTVIKYGTVERENDQGEDVKIPYMRAYRVFNADQIEGLPEQFYITPEPPRDLGTVADIALDDFFAALGVPVDTSDKPEAYYSLSKDRIHMPPISTFYNAAEFMESWDMKQRMQRVTNRAWIVSRNSKTAKIMRLKNWWPKLRLVSLVLNLASSPTSDNPPPISRAGYLP